MRLRAKLSQDKVAEHFGISRTAVTLWETAPPPAGTGTQPEADKLPILAALYRCTIDELFKGPQGRVAEENTEYVPPARFHLPLISWVSAGMREEAADPYAAGNAESWIDFDGPCSSSSFCLRVRGNSMTRTDGAEPTFPDGSIIGVDPRRKPKSREFAVFRFNDTNEATFKQYIIDGPLNLLVALNPNYPPIVIGPDAQLVGTVFEKRVIAKF